MNLRSRVFFIVLVLLGLNMAGCDRDADLTEEMKNSLVYLNISAAGFEQFQPWKYSDISQQIGVGTAVGEYEVVTPAHNVANATLIKARRYGQNEYIPAKIKVIDYQSNLCLLQLDPEAMSEPLKPVTFYDDFQKGTQLNYYWLSADGSLNTGRGYLDRAEVRRSTVSYARFLNYIVTNTSKQTGAGQVYCNGAKPIGIACFSDMTKEAGLIPAATIDSFVADARDGDYAGFSDIGFTAEPLLDPAKRAYLKMPADLKDGVYISEVFTLGTGSDLLVQGDCLLAVDGVTIDSHGRFMHPEFDRLAFGHLITSRNVGQEITFDIFRQGKPQQLKVKTRNFKASDMLVPYYEYSTQPEYLITAGFILQKLTRTYMTIWGEDWDGKVPPHLYYYYMDKSFEPTAQRRDIVILSHVLPADINLGYQSLSGIVLSRVNGMEIAAIGDVLQAQKLNPEAKYDVYEFEHDYPDIVIPREGLERVNMIIAKNYGITKLVNIDP
jgi:hypothetical protein